MAASYPSSLPVKDAAGANLSTNPHSTLHDDMYDEIVAIATELGTLPKGTAASVKARLDALPLGVIGYASVTANQAAISTGAGFVDITGLSVTWTASSSRRYKLTAHQLYEQSAVAAIVTAAITNSSNTQLNYSATSVSASDSITHDFCAVVSGISGSVTYKVRASTSNGSVTPVAAATLPAFFLVEDIGPA